MKIFEVSFDPLFDFKIKINEDEKSDKNIEETIKFFYKNYSGDKTKEYLELLAESLYYWLSEQGINIIKHKFSEGIEGFNSIDGSMGIELMEMNWYFERSNVEIREVK